MVADTTHLSSCRLIWLYLAMPGSGAVSQNCSSGIVCAAGLLSPQAAAPAGHFLAVACLFDFIIQISLYIYSDSLLQSGGHYYMMVMLPARIYLHFVHSMAVISLRHAVYPCCTMV